MVKTGPPVYLSLIIPAFNEAARIGKSLEQILGFLQSQLYTAEVIIVDDGSTDHTAELLQERFGSCSELRIYREPRNLGKGQAVKRGMLLSKGEYLFFSDADLSVPIEALPLFLSHLERDCCIALGTRQNSDSVIEVRQPIYRELLGRMFTTFSNWMLGLRFSDFTCGFKGFRREAAQYLFSRQLLPDWSFDAEILYLATLHQYRIKEIPVRWRNDQATKVRLWRDIVSSFLGLVRIRVNHWVGRYE